MQKTLQGFRELYRVTEGFTGLQKTLQGFRELYRATQGFTGLHRALQGPKNFTGLHRALQGYKKGLNILGNRKIGLTGLGCLG